MLFSFNLDCPGAKGLTILSLLPDCAALIQLGDLSFKVHSHWLGLLWPIWDPKRLKSVFLCFSALLLELLGGDAAWNLQNASATNHRGHLLNASIS